MHTRKWHTAKLILLYSTALGMGAFLLSWADYRYLVRDLRLEFYLLLVAFLFAGIGAWLAYSFAGRRIITIKNPGTDDEKGEFSPSGNNPVLLSERELEVLQAVACGMSNQQIADHLHVSVSTVKTHNASVFSKMGVQRRTQAVNKAISLGILKHSVEDRSKV
jgi:DNA-binding CsgD family transcriptional regulator